MSTPLDIFGYIANTVKRYVMNDPFQKQIIFDTNTGMLIRDVPEMKEE